MSRRSGKPDGSPDDPPVEPRKRDADAVVISLVRAEKTVVIDGKDYLLKEMTGNELDQWRGSVGARISTAKDGSTKVTNFERFTASLIARCLYDPFGKPVPEVAIAVWPAQAQKTLFELCQEMNGMTDLAEETAKKD